MLVLRHLTCSDNPGQIRPVVHCQATSGSMQATQISVGCVAKSLVSFFLSVGSFFSFFFYFHLVGVNLMTAAPGTSSDPLLADLIILYLYGCEWVWTL